MAGLACKLMNVGGVASGCTENFSGVGGYFLVALKSDLAKDTDTGLVQEPEYDDTRAEFSAESFTFESGKGFYKVMIAQFSGSVTSTANGRKKGFTNVFTGRVEDDTESASFLMRVINNTDVILLVPDGMGKHYVIYDPTFNTTLELSSTTGAAATDEAGHTVTFTVPNCRYPMVKWSGTPTMATETEAGA